MGLTAASVYRRYNTDGVPLSGDHEPDKDEIVALLTAYENAIGTGFKQVFFSTLAAATAANISATADYVVTLGRATVGDNGGATYFRISTSTAAAWRFQSADSQWWALINRIVTPEMFGAFGGADCTAAFQSLASWLNTASSGGAKVEFTNGADYKIWPAGTTPATVFALTQIRGVTFNFNSAQISTDNLFAPQGLAFIFQLDRVKGIVFNQPRYVQTAYTTLDASKGGYMFVVNDQSASDFTRGVDISDWYQSGGISGLASIAPFTLSNDGCGNFNVRNAYIEHCYYGLNFQNCGDNVTARGVRTHDTGRSYFPYGVSNHDIEIISDHGGPFNDCLLKVYANPQAPLDRNSLSNIRLRYKNVGRSNASASADLVCLNFQQGVAQVTVSGAANNGSGKVRLTVSSTANMATGQTWFFNAIGGTTEANGKRVITVIDATHVDLTAVSFVNAYTSGGYARVPATIKNIKIELDVADNTNNGQPQALVTYKHNSDNSTDTTTSGYVMENVEISGSIKNYDAGTSAIDLFGNTGNSTGTWTGETIRNIAFRNFSVDGANSSVLVDLTNISGFLLENVYSPSTVTWTLTKSERMQRLGKVDVSSIPSTGVALTANSITVPGYVDDQDFAGTATQTATLPDPTLCKDKVLNVRNTAAQTVNSASSNVVPLAGGAAGTALLAATAGKWARLKSNGTAWVITAAA